MNALASQDFKDWFAKEREPSRRMVLKVLATGATLTPHLLVFSHENEMAYVPVDLATNQDKDFVMGLQQHVASEVDKVAGVIFVSETWVLSTTDKDEIDKRRHTRNGIADHPDRKEGIMWNAVRGKMQLLAFSEIVREEGKDPALVDKDTIDPAEPKTEMTGRMVMSDDGPAH